MKVLAWPFGERAFHQICGANERRAVNAAADAGAPFIIMYGRDYRASGNFANVAAAAAENAGVDGLSDDVAKLRSGVASGRHQMRSAPAAIKIAGRAAQVSTPE